VHTGRVHLWQLDGSASVLVEEGGGAKWGGGVVAAGQQKKKASERCTSVHETAHLDSMLTTGCMQKLWEGHGWVIHAIWVQVVIIVKILWRHSCFGFWPGEGGGMQGWQEGACQDAQKHRTGKKMKMKVDSSIQCPTKSLTSTGTV